MHHWPGRNRYICFRRGCPLSAGAVACSAMADVDGEQRHHLDTRLTARPRLAEARRAVISLAAASSDANEGTTSSDGNGTWNSSLNPAP
jgi:hypothetical protein